MAVLYTNFRSSLGQSCVCAIKSPPTGNVIRVVVNCAIKSPSTGNVIRVVVNGAASNLGKTAVAAIHKARGMELVGAVDSASFVGCDAGELAGMEEAIEVPILDDLVMVLGSLSQSKSSSVMVDFSVDSGMIYDNVRQATAFGMRSVVCSAALDAKAVDGLTTFCEKASTGCIICPTLSIGRVLLQQATITAAFHYASVQVIESCSQDESSLVPSSEAKTFASNLGGLGRVYNGGDLSEDNAAKGAVIGEGVRIHSLRMPGPGMSSLEARLFGPGESLSLRHDITSEASLMPGLLLAIRRVVRLKNLVYGLEKIL